MQEGSVTQVIYRTTATGLFYALTTTPISAALNSLVQLGITWINTSDAAFQGHVELVVTKPDGTTVTPDDVMNQDLSVDPNEGATVLFESGLVDQYGTYTAQVTLTETGETTILDLETFSVATVAAAVTPAETGMTEMITAIMPLFVLMMLIMMMKPMMA